MEYGSEKVKSLNSELQKQLIKSTEISIYLQVTPKLKVNKNFDNDGNRTGVYRSIVFLIFGQPGIQRG